MTELKRLQLPFPMALSLLVFGCTATIDQEAEKQRLIAADLEFAVQTAQDGAEGWASFFTKDGVMMPNGAPDIVGQDSIRESMQQLFSQPDYQIEWHPRSAYVSTSGDLGYTAGTYSASYRGPEGQIERVAGRYVSIWKKDAMGNWKVALDIGNTASPVP